MAVSNIVRNLRDGELTILDGTSPTPQSLTLLLDEGDLVWTQRTNTIEVEDRAGNVERIKEAIEVGLGLRVQVILAEANTLPRFEAKGRRFIDNR